jgi:glycosyltransferase involved in cell wall biosynthesis
VPKVSIAVPVFNCEKYVGQALESLLAQTFGDFELVISDNASTDGTEEICRRFAAEDRRVRYVRRPTNIGGPANFSYSFSLCSGKYHKWSTADDYWHPVFLQEAVDVLDANPDVVLCYPMTRLVDAQGSPISDYQDTLNLADDSPRVRFRDLYRLIGLCNAQLGLLRRDAMVRTRLFAGHDACDTDFLGEMALLGKFYLLPDIRFFRRFHPGSSSWARDDPEHQRRFYDPGGRGDAMWLATRRILFQFGAVWRSPIGLADKLALSADVARWARYQRYAVASEIVDWLLRSRAPT